MLAEETGRKREEESRYQQGGACLLARLLVTTVGSGNANTKTSPQRGLECRWFARRVQMGQLLSCSTSNRIETWSEDSAGISRRTAHGIKRGKFGRLRHGLGLSILLLSVVLDRLLLSDIDFYHVLGDHLLIGLRGLVRDCGRRARYDNLQRLVFGPLQVWVLVSCRASPGRELIGGKRARTNEGHHGDDNNGDDKERHGLFLPARA